MFQISRTSTTHFFNKRFSLHTAAYKKRPLTLSELKAGLAAICQLRLLETNGRFGFGTLRQFSMAASVTWAALQRWICLMHKELLHQRRRETERQFCPQTSHEPKSTLPITPAHNIPDRSL
ncbi:hypothetical protein [Planktotalea sp.]|uniref:hypothetical protein n=1 Tax=Planktotalea sp. TaxID=2029877 RepID=UPI0035C7B648